MKSIEVHSALNSRISSRIISTQNCADLCCSRRLLAKKSDTGFRRKCELKAFDASSPNSVRLKSMAQIYAANGKQLICTGTLIHPKFVMTTLVCATM